MSEFNSVTPSASLHEQPQFGLDANLSTEALLDASSLHTVLTMLEVIDSLEDLALLETLTLAQKRQVWDATPEPTKARVVQLRAAQTAANGSATAALAASTTAADLALPQLIVVDSVVDSTALLQTWSSSEEASIDLEALEEVDLSLPESLELTTVPIRVAVGDWVILQAQPQLSRSELMAIWEVIEVRGNSARISSEKLGTRNYPVAWMANYPKPLEPEF